MGQGLVIRHQEERFPNKIHTPPIQSQHTPQKLAFRGPIVGLCAGQAFTIKLNRVPGITMQLLKNRPSGEIGRIR